MACAAWPSDDSYAVQFLLWSFGRPFAQALGTDIWPLDLAFGLDVRGQPPFVFHSIPRISHHGL